MSDIDPLMILKQFDTNNDGKITVEGCKAIFLLDFLLE